jgi:hypothetical protein
VNVPNIQQTAKVRWVIGTIILLGQRITQYRKWQSFPFATQYFKFFQEIRFEAPNEKKILLRPE